MPLSSPAARGRKAFPKLSLRRVEANAAPAANKSARVGVEGSGDPVQVMPVSSRVAKKAIWADATVTCDCGSGRDDEMFATTGCGLPAPS